MRFSDIVGQEEVKKQLVQTVHENRISHAQLFLGPQGSGSLSLALAYAQFISCENKQAEDSCGECSSCRKYERLIHPDLHFSYPFFAKHKDDTALTFLNEWRQAFLENPYLSLDFWRGQLDAENKQANINVAECHQIIQKLSLKPFEAEYKVLIMWLPEYLDKTGNALLKIIEEPPQKTLFLLVAQNQDQILNTILSRTQLVKINRLEDKDIEKYLIDSNQATETLAARTAYLSEGNLYNAKSLLAETGSNNLENFRNLMLYTYQNKGLEVAEHVEVLAKLGRENQKNLLMYGIKLMRECILMISGIPDLVHLPPLEMDFVSKFSKLISLRKAEVIIEELEKAHYHVERNANPKILFLDVSLQFIKVLKFNTFPKGTHYILT
ncbi:hypothetical protein GS399_02665 [Pedobacter sp. HMF7647]|uniref:DNA polymerase III subunit delta n=1 Tax=Hufsiella arboris TaxID=2695275 RepID=A0A7K1Y734_9SPHI|nr:hypothetical protein [Hufsiella arboris]MXV49858.1 hypothetical protein [Hufsiella arboris]